MTIAGVIIFWIGAAALTGALGFVLAAVYWSLLGSCAGNAECLGAEGAFLLIALGLAFLGVFLIAVGRVYRLNPHRPY
jgi:hypothetical protein